MGYAGYMAGPARRRQILEGAKRVFAARGYHETNISHICEDLGIGRGTLYQYFDSKKAVFAAIIEDLLERLRQAIATRPPLELPEGYRPATDEVLRFTVARLRHVFGIVLEDEASLRILLREAVGLDVQVDAVLAAIDEIVREACVRDLQTAQRLGVVRADIDAHSVAMMTIGAVEKLALDALRRSDAPLDIDRLSDQVARFQLLGILETREGER